MPVTLFLEMKRRKEASKCFLCQSNNDGRCLTVVNNIASLKRSLKTKILSVIGLENAENTIGLATVLEAARICRTCDRKVESFWSFKENARQAIGLLTNKSSSGSETHALKGQEPNLSRTFSPPLVDRPTERQNTGQEQLAISEATPSPAVVQKPLRRLLPSEGIVPIELFPQAQHVSMGRCCGTVK